MWTPPLVVKLCFLLSPFTSPSAAEAARGGEREGRLCLDEIGTERSRSVAAANHRSGRSARRAGLGEARFVISQDSHSNHCGSRSTAVEAPESNAAGAHVLFNFMSCPPRLSQGLFFCMHVNWFFSHSWPSYGPIVILDIRWLALSGLYNNVFGKRSCCSVHGDRCARCT